MGIGMFGSPAFLAMKALLCPVGGIDMPTPAGLAGVGSRQVMNPHPELVGLLPHPGTNSPEA